MRLTPSERDRALARPRSAISSGARPTRRRRAKPSSSTRDDLADAVDVALDDVAAEPVGGPHRQLEVDPVARPRAPPSAVTLRVWFIASVSKPSASAAVAVRQTPLTATESPAAISRREPGRDPQPRAVGAGLERLDRADVLDQPGEHLTTP